MPSAKWPDRFSRSDACNAKPESLRDTGVLGKLIETGDGIVVGDGGEAPEELLLAPVELVDGLSLPVPELGLCSKKPLNTVAFEVAVRLEASPNVVELSLT